jgi:hypothetical protein
MAMGNESSDHKIERAGAVIWSTEIASGERRMSHSLANIEHHRFKYPQHRPPGYVHIRFYGAGAFSFGDGVELQDGDESEIAFVGYGRALRNPVSVEGMRGSRRSWLRWYRLSLLRSG